MIDMDIKIKIKGEYFKEENPFNDEESSKEHQEKSFFEFEFSTKESKELQKKSI